MAITNYGQLKTELSGYMFNTRLATSYDNATLLFESVVNRGLPATDANGRKYICFPRNMEAQTSLTTSSGSVALPSDYIAWRTVLYTGVTPYVELDYVHPAYLRSTVIENDTGDPKIFTIEAGTFYARPVKDTASIYQFHYYQKLTTITTSDSTTNWLLTNHPDAYLWGVLTELFAKARNREAAELYKARRDEIFSDIAKSSGFTTGATSPQARQGVYF
jgi:hypothetical protein